MSNTIARENMATLLSASHVIAGTLADKEAKVAPIPSVTKMIGKAQQNIVEREVNKLKNGKIMAFILFIIVLSGNLNHIVAIIHDGFCNFYI